MNVAEAVELVGRWPQDRSVPSQLQKAVQAAKGVERQQLGMMFEALVAAAETAEDHALISKYFG